MFVKISLNHFIVESLPALRVQFIHLYKLLPYITARIVLLTFENIILPQHTVLLLEHCQRRSVWTREFSLT